MITALFKLYFYSSKAMTCLIVASKESQFHELEFQNIDHSFVLLLIIGSLIIISPE